DRPEAILFAIIHRAPAALSDLNADVPKSLEQIVNTLLGPGDATAWQHAARPDGSVRACGHQRTQPGVRPRLLHQPIRSIRVVGLAIRLQSTTTSSASVT